jgi:parvulin-like peptidyl-prolyl isomerase
VCRRAFRALAALAVLAAVLVAGCDDGTPSPAASFVATVDGRGLPVTAVEAVRAESKLLGEEVGAEEAIDLAVERELLRREAERLGVTADASAVQRRVAAVAAQLGGDDALERALQAAGMTRPQLQQALEAAELFEAVGRIKYPERRADDADARRFYQRNRADFTTPAAVDLGAIFVRNEGIAGNALDRLAAGRPFEEVSRQFSIDPELKDQQGRLGWIDPRSLPGDLGEAVAELREGEVSTPVAGGGGVWIFKVFERRAGRVTPFGDVRDEIVRQLTVRRRARALDAWLDEAREAAAVERF